MKTPTLELAFSVRLQFGEGPRVRFKHAYGGFQRGFVSVVGGEISGPKLQGIVVPNSGGDWPQIWDNGFIEFEAHYMMRAKDDTPIYIKNRGVAFSSAEVLAKLEAGQPVDPDASYVRVTPRFDVPPGPHEWLARTIFVGIAERRGSHSVFDYYMVT